MSNSKLPLILFANSFFGQPVEVDASVCGDACEFTNDRSRVAEAAAVVFHIPSLHEVSRAKKYPGQLWVAWSMESIANYPALADPAFLANFDLRMSYEQSADVWCPYLPYERQWEQALETAVEPKTATATAVMFQSAPLNDSGRNEFASELVSLMRVDSFGRFLNNRQLEVPDEGGKTKLAVVGGYKFCLGLENSICPDYVTEKFFDPFLAGTVPVYRGAPNVEDFAPGPHSYIDASDFAGPPELAEYLNYLDNDNAAYREYFAWREQGLSPRFQELLRRRGHEPFYRLAALVQQRPQAWQPPGLLQRLRAPVIQLGAD